VYPKLDESPYYAAEDTVSETTITYVITFPDNDWILLAVTAALLDLVKFGRWDGTSEVAVNNSIQAMTQSIQTFEPE